MMNFLSYNIHATKRLYWHIIEYAEKIAGANLSPKKEPWKIWGSTRGAIPPVFTLGFKNRPVIGFFPAPPECVPATS